MVLIAGLAVGMVAIALGGMVSLFSVMLFDAPDSDSNPWLRMLAIGIWSTPVLGLLSIVACAVGLVMHSSRPWRFGLALAAALLPLLGVVVAVSGAILLQVRCGGDFVCR